MEDPRFKTLRADGPPQTSPPALPAMLAECLLSTERAADPRLVLKPMATQVSMNLGAPIKILIFVFVLDGTDSDIYE